MSDLTEENPFDYHLAEKLMSLYCRIKAGEIKAIRIDSAIETEEIPGRDGISEVRPTGRTTITIDFEETKKI